jgi:hypothetical protein
MHETEFAFLYFVLLLFLIAHSHFQVSGLSLIVDEVDSTEIPVAMTVYSILQALSSALGCILGNYFIV